MARGGAVELTEVKLHEIADTGDWKVEWKAGWSHWRMLGEARPIDGRFGITTFSMQLDAGYDGSEVIYPPGGITSRVVQQIPIGQLLDALRAWIVQDRDLEATAEEWGLVFTADAKRARQDRGAAVSRPRALGRGRPPLSDAYLAEVALFRLALVDRGVVKGIHREMAQHFGIAEKTAKEHLRMARKRGFLEPALPGSRGALPGPSLQTYTEERV